MSVNFIVLIKNDCAKNSSRFTRYIRIMRSWGRWDIFTRKERKKKPGVVGIRKERDWDCSNQCTPRRHRPELDMQAITTTTTSESNQVLTEFD